MSRARPSSTRRVSKRPSPERNPASSGAMRTSAAGTIRPFHQAGSSRLRARGRRGRRGRPRALTALSSNSSSGIRVGDDAAAGVIGDPAARGRGGADRDRQIEVALPARSSPGPPSPGRAARSSSAAMAAIAWIFGAPVIEAGGKAARSSSDGRRRPARRRPRTVETVWCSVGRVISSAWLVTSTLPVAADPAEVVAHHVDDHRRARRGPSRSPASSRASARSSRGVGAARPGALDRPRLDARARARRGTARGRSRARPPAPEIEDRRRGRPGWRRAGAGRAARGGRRRARFQPAAEVHLEDLARAR